MILSVGCWIRLQGWSGETRISKRWGGGCSDKIWWIFGGKALFIEEMFLIIPMHLMFFFSIHVIAHQIIISCFVKQNLRIHSLDENFFNVNYYFRRSTVSSIRFFLNNVHIRAVFLLGKTIISFTYRSEGISFVSVTTYKTSREVSDQHFGNR